MIVFKGGKKSKTGQRTGLGKNFLGLTDYLEKGPRANPNPERVAWSAIRNLDAETPAEAARLMQLAAADSPKVQLPVYHFGLSLEPGEHLPQKDWEKAADRVLARMGLAGHQAIVLAHNDTAKEHVHIVVNRVGPDGRAWRPFRDMVAAREVVRALELEHGLRRTGREQPTPDLSAGTVREAMRTGVQPLADRVREEAGRVFAAATSWQDLEAGLARLGYRLEPAERGSGLVVTDGSRRASLSHVDRNLSGPKLAARFGETFREHRAQHPEPPRVEPRPGTVHQPLPGSTVAERAEALLDRLTSTRATFTRADVQRAVFHEPESHALARHALDRGSAAAVGKDARGHTRYASAVYLRDEERLFTAAGDLAGRRALRLDPGQAGRALDRAPHLSAEQRAVVLHATTGDDLALIVGRAGAGKTTAAATIAHAYREAGYEVHGGALAGKAAETLEREAGIPARTLHSWEYAWERGHDRLHAGSVLVIDEAGMVDARQLGRVLDQAQAASAKVILIGDPDQLKPIGPGDGFRGLLEQHRPAWIETIRRQTEPWQREASEHLAGGRVSTALDAYHEAGRLHVAASRDAARAELLGQYVADRRAAPEREQLVLAYRNDDVRQLNAAIRAERQAAGELAPGHAVAGVEYSAGDRIVFLKNDHRGLEVANVGRADQRGQGGLRAERGDRGERSVPADRADRSQGVKNGTLATLESVAPDRFVARLDDGRRVAWSPEQYDRIAHGYAVTVHKSQGATVDRTYVLADPLMNRNASYVALTRHREGVQVYTDRETFADREQLDRALSRAPSKDLARDYAAATIERQAERVTPLRERESGLRGQLQHLRNQIDTIEHAESFRDRLAGARANLERAASQVYADPHQAIERLTADPRVIQRLYAGEAAAYGQVHGQLRRFRGPDAGRQAAESAVPALRNALTSHRNALHDVAKTRPAAERLGGAARLPALRAELQQVVSTLQRVQHALKGPEKALEAVVREVGTQAARLALAALPSPVRLPVQVAIRAVERAIDLALDLGLGR